MSPEKRDCPSRPEKYFRVVQTLIAQRHTLEKISGLIGDKDRSLEMTYVYIWLDADAVERWFLSRTLWCRYLLIRLGERRCLAVGANIDGAPSSIDNQESLSILYDMK